MNIEIWKFIPGYQNLYMVSTYGRVKSMNYRYTGTTKILKQTTNKFGYKMVGLRKNGKTQLYQVHRLVATTFIQNPNNLPEVNHKDEDKSNNNINNLEWITHKDNCNHGTRNKRMSQAKKGKQHTEETRRKMSQNHANFKGENSPMYGKHHTEEAKRKMSQAKKDKNRGKDNPNAKAVLMFTLDGQFIRRFDCVADANEYLGKDRYTPNIGMCAKGNYKTAYGYIWKFEE